MWQMVRISHWVQMVVIFKNLPMLFKQTEIGGRFTLVPLRLVYQNKRPPQPEQVASRDEKVNLDLGEEFRNERNSLRDEINPVIVANLKKYGEELRGLSKSPNKDFKLGDLKGPNENGEFMIPVWYNMALGVFGKHVYHKVGVLVFTLSTEVVGKCDVVFIDSSFAQEVPITYSTDYTQLLEEVSDYKSSRKTVYDGLVLWLNNRDSLMFQKAENKQYLVINSAGVPVCTVKQVGELPTGEIEYEVRRGEDLVGSCALQKNYNLEPLRDIIRKLL